jgi:hypothetical protein
MSDPAATPVKTKKTAPGFLRFKKEKAGKKKSLKKAKDNIFVEANQTITSSAFGFGYLTVNRRKVKLLLFGGAESQWQLRGNDKEVTSHAYRVEPRLRFDFKNAPGFLAKSQLFFRAQYDAKAYFGKRRTTHSLATELVHKFPKESVVLRANVSASNLENPDIRETKLAFAPFIKTSAFPVPLLGRIKFRFAPEYTRNFTSGENSLLIHLKVEGNIKHNPWWGWHLQTFWAVNVDGKKDRDAFSFAGLYFWLATFLPEKLFGKGRFVEGGISLEKVNPKDGSNSFWRGGVNLKVKFGSECRWWQ